MGARAASVTPVTRWLDDEEQRVWRSYLVASGAVADALDRQLQRDAGIPHAYYMIMAMLSEQDDRALRMHELAALLRASPSRTSHAVSRLEEAGWVRRERSAADRRGSVAVLTDAGMAKVRSAAPGHVETVRRHLFDVLTPDQVRALGEISAAVLGTLDVADHLAVRGLPRPG